MSIDKRGIGHGLSSYQAEFSSPTGAALPESFLDDPVALAKVGLFLGNTPLFEVLREPNTSGILDPWGIIDSESLRLDVEVAFLDQRSVLNQMVVDYIEIQSKAVDDLAALGHGVVSSHINPVTVPPPADGFLGRRSEATGVRFVSVRPGMHAGYDAATSQLAEATKVMVLCVREFILSTALDKREVKPR